MSFRQRTSRFGGTTLSQTEQRNLPPALVPSSLTGGFLTQRPPTTTTRKKTRKKTKRPTRKTTTKKRVTKRPTVTRVTRVTTRKPTRRPTTVFRRQPERRDDFQRSLTPTIIPRAFAEEAPRTAPQALGEISRTFLGVDPSRIAQPREVTREPELIQTREPPKERPVVKGIKKTRRPTRSFERIESPIPISPERPTPKPRDDIQIATIPQAFAEEPERIIPPRPRVAVPLAEQQEANIRAIEAAGGVTFGQAQARDLDPVTGFIQSFGGGARQEFENIGAIAGVGTAREEVGSLAVDLPFAVGEALLTREAPEGQGFFGLGFDFRPITQLGFEEAQEVSGRQQEKIGRKFEEDPARALGSIATIGAIEAGLFVATGGVGNVARRGIAGVAGRVATKKQRKIAEEVAKKADEAIGEKNVPQFLEPVGDGKFLLIRGIDALGERGISVVKGNQAVIVRKVVNKKTGETVEQVKNIKLLKGVKEAKRKKALRPQLDATDLELERLGLSTDTSTPRAVLGAKSDIPAVLIDTKKRVVRNVAGDKITVPPRTIGFNREILAVERLSPLQRPETIRIEGVQTKIFQSVKEQLESGLKPVRGKTLTVEGKPTLPTLQSVRAQERTGFTQPTARGLVFLTQDVRSSPKEIFSIIKTGKTLPREALTPEELRTGRIGGRKLSSLEEITSIGERPLDVPTFEVFGSQALSPRAGIEFVEEASRAGLNVDDFFKGIVKSGKSKKATPKAKAPTFDEAEKALDKFAKEQGGRGQRTVITKAPTKAQPRETSIRSIFQAFEEPRVRPRGRLKTRAEARIDVIERAGLRGILPSVLPAEISRQVQIDDIAQVTGEGIRIAEGQRLIEEQGTGLIPQLGTGQINIFEPRPPRETIIPEFGVGETLIQDPFLGQIVTPQLDGGIPVVPFRPEDDPFRPVVPVPAGAPPTPFPFGELERRRRVRARRRSRLGRRIFDVADEPFGAITVGLGFFAEQETGRETIEELIGEDDQVLTRQERQARARLGRGGRRRQRNFAEGFDFADFFG